MKSKTNAVTMTDSSGNIRGNSPPARRWRQETQLAAPVARLSAIVGILALLVTLSACSIISDPEYGKHASKALKNPERLAIEGLWHRHQAAEGYEFVDTFLFNPDGSGLAKSKTKLGHSANDHAVRRFRWQFVGGGAWEMRFDDEPDKLFTLRTDGVVLLRSYSSSAGSGREVLKRVSRQAS